MTFLGWRTRHRALDGWLRAAARAAPEGEERFRAAWRPFAAALRLHLAQEERWLLPAFAALPSAPNQRSEVVAHDHRLIDRSLVDIERVVADLPGAVARAEALSLLIQVLDHHDRREAGGMLAALDAHLPAPTRVEWLTAIAEEERALGVDEPPALGEAARAWVCASDDPADRLAAAAALDQSLTEAADALPAVAGPNGARVGRGVRAAVTAWGGAPDLATRRDRLIDVLDALRRWRAVRDSQDPPG